MSETPRTDYGLLDWLDENQERSREFATHKEFFAKHALGPKAPPSCFMCGREVRGTPAIQHMELPGVVACHSCRDAPRDLRECVGLLAEIGRPGLYDMACATFKPHPTTKGLPCDCLPGKARALLARLQVTEKSTTMNFIPLNEDQGYYGIFVATVDVPKDSAMVYPVEFLPADTEILRVEASNNNGNTKISITIRKSQRSK